MCPGADVAASPTSPRRQPPTSGSDRPQCAPAARTAHGIVRVRTEATGQRLLRAFTRRLCCAARLQFVEERAVCVRARCLVRCSGRKNTCKRRRANGSMEMCSAVPARRVALPISAVGASSPCNHSRSQPSRRCAARFAAAAAVAAAAPAHILMVAVAADDAEAVPQRRQLRAQMLHVRRLRFALFTQRSIALCAAAA